MCLARILSTEGKKYAGAGVKPSLIFFFLGGGNFAYDNAGAHFTPEPEFPANTKHLYNIYTMLDQRRRRWADVVWMLYKCFVFAGLAPKDADFEV